MATIEEARIVLQRLAFDEQRTNERSALVLLALAGLTPNRSWDQANAATQRVLDVMNHIRRHFDKDYAANTRETLRKETLYQFTTTGLIVKNPDQPARPVNSPNTCYQLAPDALDLLRAVNTAAFEKTLETYLQNRPGLRQLAAAHRDLTRIPVVLPGGRKTFLSPGGQNDLIASIIEEFCPRFTPGAEVIYLGDAGAKWSTAEQSKFAELEISIDEHGKIPDIVIWDQQRGWLVLVEAVTSHGPVNYQRKRELEALFAESKFGLVFVTCFATRADFKSYAADIAWETEVWCADNPTHMVHFNGERFLGPYARD